MSDTSYGQALRRYADNSNTISDLITTHGIQVRDVIILSAICSQGSVAPVRLAELLGFEQSILNLSLTRLERAGLLSIDNDADVNSTTARATQTGISITNRFEHTATTYDEL